MMEANKPKPSMESSMRIILEPRRLRFKLLQLKREALFTDITLTCHGRSLHVHKCILSASSLFFKLLFTTSTYDPLRIFDLTEAVQLENFECLESIINYMYSGEIHLSEENFVVMASLSEFFAMSDLTGLCLNYLSRILNEKSCLKLYLEMRQKELTMKKTQYPVLVYRATEIQNMMFEVLEEAFYKTILLQDEMLQVSTDDMLHLLSKGMVKHFCVENVLQFLVKWLNLHSDTEAHQIASKLVDLAYEKIVTEKQTYGVNTTRVSELVRDLQNILEGSTIPEDFVSNITSKVTVIRDELMQDVINYPCEVKQEVIDEPETETESLDVVETEAEDKDKDPVMTEVGNMDSEGPNEEKSVYSDTDHKEETFDAGKKTFGKASTRKNWKKIKVVITRLAKKNKMTVVKGEVSEDLNDNNVLDDKKPVKTKRKRAATRKALPLKYDEDTEEEGHEPDVSTMAELDQEIKQGIETAIQDVVEKSHDGKYLCLICDKGFKTKNSLNVHMNIHTGNKPHRCVECGMLFGRTYHVIRHMRRKHGDKEKFECDVCQKEYTDPKDMVAHSREHFKELVDEKPKEEQNDENSEYAEIKVNEAGKEEYWCKECKKQFSRHSHLREHIMIHTGNRPFKCGTCNSQFKSKYDLNKHVNTVHLGIMARFKCENCKRPFNVKETFDRHTARCVGKGYHCEKCGASFHRQYHLDRHLAVHSDDRPFRCPQCPKTFKYDNKLKAHIKNHNEEEVARRSVICELCGTVLKDVKYLKRHLISHTGVKPHKCPVCLKTYTQAAGLQVHMRIHTGAKPFQCEICSMLFSVKSNLMRHQRRHRGDRRHKCDQCGKGFVMMSDLKRHYTMHTGEKNFACRYCGKKFSSNSKLPQHERIHTGEKPYECRVCGKRFIQSGDRKRHEAIHGLKASPKTKTVSLYDMANSDHDLRTDARLVVVAAADDAETVNDSMIDSSMEIDREVKGVNSDMLIDEAVSRESLNNEIVNREPVSSQVLSMDPATNHAVAVVSSQILCRDPVRNQIVSRDTVRSQVLSRDTVGSHLKTGAVLIRDRKSVAPSDETVEGNQSTNAVGCVPEDLSYIPQSSGIVTSQAQNEVLMRDMYTASSVYSSQNTTSTTFLASLSDNNFIHY